MVSGSKYVMLTLIPAMAKVAHEKNMRPFYIRYFLVPLMYFVSVTLTPKEQIFK